MRRPALSLCLFAALLLGGRAAAQEGETPPGEPEIRELYDDAVALLASEGFAAIDDAIQGFELVVAADPDFLDAYYGAADAWLLKYEFSEKKDPRWLARALEYADAVIEGDGELARAWHKRASILFSMDQIDDAAAALGRAIEIDPAYLEARGMLLQILLSRGEGEEGRKFAKDSLEHCPGDPAPLKYFGDIFAREGLTAEAAAYYRDVIGLVPEAPYTRFALGNIYQGEGKFGEALVEYGKALEQAPDFVDTHVAMSYCYGETGDIERALEHIEAYLEANPRDVSALNNAALLYEQAGRQRKARIAWLKVKESTDDKTYLERAERHLHRLLSSAPRPSGGGGKEDGVVEKEKK